MVYLIVPTPIGSGNKFEGINYAAYRARTPTAPAEEWIAVPPTAYPAMVVLADIQAAADALYARGEQRLEVWYSLPGHPAVKLRPHGPMEMEL